MLNLHEDYIKRTLEKLSDVIRAEYLQSDSYLDLYVGIETLKNINNIKNQVIYGRRGTGKTHLFLAARENYINNFETERRFPIYIDLRKLLPLISVSNNDNVEFAILIFKYICQQIIDVLIKNIKFIYSFNEFEPDNATERSKRDKLVRTYENLNYEFDGKEFKKLDDFSLSEEELRKISGSLKASKTLEMGINGEKQVKDTKSINRKRFISFADISGLLSEVPLDLDINRIIVMLDEWSEIPVESQPYLAELLKRGFITSDYSFKIAAIPSRSKLGIRSDTKFIGLEEGGDIFGFYLDNRFVFEINKQQTRDFFNEMLFRHLTAISNELKTLYLDTKTKKASSGFINEFFANIALREILIASAGIPRDFINLFINAYDQFLLNVSSQSRRIGVKHIRLATVDWYRSDKKDQVDNFIHAKQLLEKIINDIVLKKQKTHFLIPEKHSDNEYLQQLIDLRVIHLRKKGYSHKDNKGVAYNVYSVDYGCYTSINIHQPNLDSGLIQEIDSIDNFRDIRRVSLEDNFFNEFLLQVGEAFNCPHCSKPIDTKHLAYVKQNLCNHCYEKIEVPVTV
ncbi:hypothetical protein PN4B1_48750 [Paenibacillus naphthalenovorans]|uniref:ORC-CDC6 family AAA ATPase n=1 Tax=Paenibacillus naphthalenovorans TaxID=162209 RepID=UPI0010B10CA1|nr:ATP-binding protein [Paenibacillus naphthalenovorans]GCL74889.1 hypothetical protein PN4B1_48750 [Paenibacillus naphthalenovorans]